MARRRSLIGGGLIVVYGLLVLNGAEHDRKSDGPHEATASFCHRGVMPSICLGCTAQSAVIHEDWGPPEFRMSARVLAIPGFQVGYLTNSAGVCTPEEATAYGEGLDSNSAASAE